MNSHQNTNSFTALGLILWGIIVPQAFLVVINIRSWTLISGEANQSEINYALALFSFEFILLVIAILVLCLHLTKKIHLDWKVILFSLCAHITYIWLFLFTAADIIPDSIQPWIVNEGNVGRWNITMFMPGAFLSLYALSRLFFSRVSEVKARIIVLLTTIGMPVIWYLLVSLSQPAWFGQISVIISILIATTVVIVFLGAIIRFFDNIIHKPSSTTLVEKHYIIAIFIGLAAPLGGLALNKTIPFPVDLQSIGVYVLTVVNGLVLFIKPEGQAYSPIRLFLRCIVFPFTLYFFLVFLPFLPLSLIAIIAVGAGFLMLTPLALGLFQTRITLNEYNLTKAKLGISKAIIVSVLGLSVLPAYFLMQALMDKNALDASLEYFYSHDTSSELLSESQISRSTDALVQLRDRKVGIQLPYISGIYNAIVFGDLVLSDKKISKMYTLLKGRALPEEKASISGARNSSRRNFRSFGIVAPKQNVKISNLVLEETSKGESTVTLTLQNNLADTHSLFVGQLDIPEGVFISGLRLKIEDEWVSGRIFDKKTALWVFQKITEVRRDPALLYYLSSQQAELRVYPFPSMGIRELEIDFQYHPNVDSKITIADQEIDLNPTFNSASIISQSGATLVRDNISELAFQRTPYVHFILDYSAGVNTKDKRYAKKINQVRKQLNIADFRVTAANIGVSKSSANELLDTTDLEELTKHIQTIKFPKTGGLWVQQAIAKQILHVKETISRESFRRTPIFVILSDQKFNSGSDLGLNSWSWLIPDLRGWYSYLNGNLQFHEFQSHSGITQDDNIPTNSVIAIQQGSKISILSANRSSVLGSSKGENLTIYNSTTDRFSAPITVANESSVNAKWSVNAGIWTDWKRTNLNPAEIESRRRSFLEQSRTQSLLLPLTSLIVVESSSQWEILKRKEKQSLSNHSGLDFEEEQQTSEPPWWLLLVGLLMFLYVKEKTGKLL